MPRRPWPRQQPIAALRRPTLRAPWQLDRGVAFRRVALNKPEKVQHHSARAAHPCLSQHSVRDALFSHRRKAMRPGSSYISASVRTNGSPSNGMIPSSMRAYMVRTGEHGSHSRRWRGQSSTGRVVAPFAGWIGSSSSRSLRIGEVRSYTAASLHPDIWRIRNVGFRLCRAGLPDTLRAMSNT